MNTEELRKLLKENGVVAYTYWGKDKLIDLAKINKTITRTRTRTRRTRDTKKNKLAAIKKY